MMIKSLSRRVGARTREFVGRAALSTAPKGSPGSESASASSASGGSGSSIPTVVGIAAGLAGGVYIYASYTGQDPLALAKASLQQAVEAVQGKAAEKSAAPAVTAKTDKPAEVIAPSAVPAEKPNKEATPAVVAAVKKETAPATVTPVAAPASAAPVAAPATLPTPAPSAAPVVAPPAPVPASAPKPNRDYLTLPAVPSEIRSMQVPRESVTASLNDLEAQSVALRKELDNTLLRDLNTLDANALRTRVAQLAAEFFERTKWEGVRMHQALRLVEADVSKRYLDLLAQQRAELEVEANKSLQARENGIFLEASRRNQEVIIKQEEMTNATLRAQAEGFKSAMDAALKKQEAELEAQYRDDMNHNLARLREGHVQQMMSVQGQISELQAQIAAFHSAAYAIGSSKVKSVNMHKHSAAVMTLENALKSSAPLGQYLSAVKDSCDSDPLVLAVLSSIPAEVATRGAPTVSELKTRFGVVRSEVRKVALAPEGLPNVIGHVVGSGLAKLYWAPSGPVKGDGTEEILSRAAYCLDQGRLTDALTELDAVSGSTEKGLLSDWYVLAQHRLSADMATVALRSNAIIKHSSIAETN